MTAPAARVQAAPASLAPDLSSCAREKGRTSLYIQIYDDASLPAATALRDRLQASAKPAPARGEPLLVVAPIENVIRGADLRQQRRPVAVAKPTLVLHDPGSGLCAQAIARAIGPPWRAGPDGDTVPIRALSSVLIARPGVIELWLPPTEPKASGVATDRPEADGVAYK